MWRCVFCWLAFELACGPNHSDWHARPLAQQQQPSVQAVAHAAQTSATNWGGLMVRELGAPARTKVLVLLHGYRAPGDDLVPFAEQLVARCSDLRAVVPAAPIVVTPSSVPPGRAWFSLHENERNIEELESAHDALLGVIDTLYAQGVRSQDIVLGGFSQGAILSADLATRNPEKVGALLLFSGRTLPHWSGSLVPVATPLRVFVAHGNADNVLPFSEGQALVARFRQQNADVVFFSFPGGHSIPAEAEAAAQNFLCP